ncbi:MAG: ABC transporter substrate-binding protein [Firmicutes bacterium]|nr:ABC transporter substrate-binding protein [Bacillota bacterium]
MSKKLLILFVSLVLALSLAVSCKPKEAPKTEAPKAASEAPKKEEPKKEEPKKEEPKKEEPKVVDKPVVIGIGAEPNNLDPQSLNDGTMRYATGNIFETLVQQPANSYDVKPLLATRWENTGENTWRFYLREGVKFHNGEPFNADAVVFSVQRIVDPAYESGLMTLLKTVKSAKAEGNLVVDIITDGKDPILPARLAWLPIVAPKHVQAVGKDVVDKPVGTGPYKFVDWNRGSQINLERFDGYWGEKPAVGKVQIKFVKEDATRLLALRNGEIHIATNMLPEYVAQLPAVKSISGLEFPMIRIGAEKPALKDKRVRQAMNYAVDKDTLRDTLYGGFAKVSPCQQAKLEYPWANPTLRPYPFDPEKSKQLLKDAGYKGQQLELIGERGRWLKDAELVEAVGAMLNDAGFKVKVSIIEFSKWLDTYFMTKEPADMIFVAYSNDIGDADLPFSGNIASTGRSSTYLKNIPDLDQAIKDNRVEMDINKRNQTYWKLWERICDDPPWIFLLNLTDIYGTNVDLNWDPRQDQMILVKDIGWKK